MTLYLLASCSGADRGLFIATKSANEYSQGRVESFIFTYPNEDTISKADLMAFVRYDREFKYRDLCFELKITSPENVEWCDSLSIEMIDVDGNPVGRRNVMLYNHEAPLIESMKFGSMGSYVISITPLEKEIEGLRDIGIQIER